MRFLGVSKVSQKKNLISRDKNTGLIKKKSGMKGWHECVVGLDSGPGNVFG